MGPQEVIFVVLEGFVKVTLFPLFCLVLQRISLVGFSQVSSLRGFSAPTHLLYADDVMIFCRGTVRNLKNIMSAFEVYSNISDFWSDNWLGVPILELLGIPDYLASFLRARVSDFIHEGRWVLDNSFRARFPDLYFRIDRIIMSPVADSLVWAHSRDGQVSCKSAYSRMNCDSPQVSWWRDVWCCFIPPSRSALTWRLLLNRLPTEDRMCRAGLHLASRCSVCEVSSESSDHLFLLCPIAAAL
ncbi:hypothetical protein Dsin_027644 [Dipteronia sinensis]|uniref:Reverse transcriptase zinc-binding domain-containing protein n=1 Tax=Dipteronia sinensis TaxID=43782 RepID=A0AAD9ZNW2_9ROSI|nr:hypothetical protein Dsin_027644 [Dipteronia sinensis]